MRLVGLAILVIWMAACSSEKLEVVDQKKLALQEAHRIDSLRLAIGADRKAAELKELILSKAKHGFNGNALVAQSGIVLLDTAIGMASFEDKIPLDRHSSFQLASISKTFTAVSILQLVEKGKLSLDLTVQEYFPEFPYPGVTIRSLLSHRSGLPYYEYNFEQKARGEHVFPDNQLLMQWFALADPKLKAFNLPDHYFSYNNTNFAILAAIVEKVTNEDFGHYLKKHIFQPLGMEESFVARGLNESSLHRTYGYQRGRRVPFDTFDNILGDKGVFSSTHDLFKWYQALATGKVVSRDLLKEAFTPRSFEHPGLRNYGYGFRLWVNEKQKTDYIYHTGWWKGYNTIFFFDPKEDFLIVLLSNKYNRSVYNIRNIIEVLHSDERSTSVEENILDD
ncbi:beta-lactamase family protein [Marinilongibacter aquaticus]|uniref:serine hydrolase domain-containing protein n=1 Tax=Marinilongibacter aquaticus TaxID=2975157 RepID=UPI0021BD19A4|nr:serine hydrolase domain-containing protein [Marinilongibacter aquaticus]UBM57600.1 beta-lactamase family protein [Marinilongibacter aquaticus]